MNFNFKDEEYEHWQAEWSKFEERLSDYQKILRKYNERIMPEEIYNVAVRLAEIDSITLEEIATQHLKLYLKDGFNNQISNIYSEEKGVLSLNPSDCDDDSDVYFEVLEDEILICDGNLDFYEPIIYVDNPFILDESFDERHNNSHRRSLKYHLIKSPDKNQAIEQILAEKKLKNVLALLNTVCEGELSFQNTITYRLGKTGKSLDIKNLSTGLKSFAILKTLLLNGSLSLGSVLILDEPEIHLHPEWQLVYAELIVLLQKEFKLTILLTTHSPYFLRALEVYAGKYAIADKCNYYFAKNEGQEAMIYDVTEDKSEVFRKLSRPLQELENLRWQNED